MDVALSRSVPVVLNGRNVGAWIDSHNAAALLSLPPEAAWQEWVFSIRVNRSGVGDDDPTLVEPYKAAQCSTGFVAAT